MCKGEVRETHLAEELVVVSGTPPISSGVKVLWRDSGWWELRTLSVAQRIRLRRWQLCGQQTRRPRRVDRALVSSCPEELSIQFHPAVVLFYDLVDNKHDRLAHAVTPPPWTTPQLSQIRVA